MKKPVYTRHTRDAIIERKLDTAWIERTVFGPEWTKPDPSRPGVERRFRAIPEYGNRVLRVVCFETDTEIRILTAFFDRDAGKNR